MKIEPLIQTVDLIERKNFKIYFFTVDTMGAPLASIEYIYRAAKALSSKYDVTILFEPNENGEYIGVKDWLGEEFSSLTHLSSKDKDLNITTADVIFIPELFSTLMNSLKTIPCHKIVLSQVWTSILEHLDSDSENVEEYFNVRWDTSFKITDVITTSEKQKGYIKGLMPTCKIEIVEPVISKDFNKDVKLKKPVVAILSRHVSDTDRMVKAFYTKYPMYKWISFKNMKGLSKKNFAKELSDCCLAVWVDRESSFGTFPLECMKSNVPLMGLLPDMMVPYMEEDNKTKENAIWVTSKHGIHTYVAEFITSWMRDNLDAELVNSTETYYENLTEEKFENNFLGVFEGFVDNRKKILVDAIEEYKNLPEPEVTEEGTKESKLQIVK